MLSHIKICVFVFSICLLVDSTNLPNHSNLDSNDFQFNTQKDTQGQPNTIVESSAGIDQTKTVLKQSAINMGQTAHGVSGPQKSFASLLIGDITSHYIFFEEDISFLESNGPAEQILLEIIKWEQEPILLMSCSFVVPGTCFINTDFLQKGDYVALSISCSSACEYSITPQPRNLQILLPNTAVRFALGQTNTKLFSINLGSESFTQLRLMLRPELATNFVLESKLYASFGSEPTPNHFDYESSSLWSGKEYIFLKRHQIRQQNLFLLSTGSLNTVYILQSQIIEHASHQIKISQSVYQALDSNETKAYLLPLLNPQVPTLCRISVFTGEVKATLYRDSKLTSRVNIEPLQFMKDIQFILDSQEAQTPQIYLLLEVVGSRQAVTAVKVSQRKVGQSILLEEGAYELVQLTAPQVAIHPIHIWIKQQFELIKYQIKVVSLIGNATLDFSLSGNSSEPPTYISSSLVTNLGRTRTYSLNIINPPVRSFNSLQYETTLNITFSQAGLGALLGVEITRTSSTTVLRESKPASHHIDAEMQRLYSFNNVDRQVTAIQFRFSVLEGAIGYRISRAGFEADNQFQSRPLTFTIRRDLLKPIYIEVIGIRPALYTLSVSLQSGTSNIQGTPTVELNEDFPMVIVLGPQATEVVALTKSISQGPFQLVFHASTTLQLCLLEQNNVCPSELPNYKMKAVFTLVQLQNQRLRIRNPSKFITSRVELEVMSVFESRCFARSFSKAYPLQVFSREECIYFVVSAAAPVQLEIFVGQKIQKNEIIVQLCGEKLESKSGQYLYYDISVQNIKSVCTAESSQMLTVVFGRDLSENFDGYLWAASVRALRSDSRVEVTAETPVYLQSQPQKSFLGQYYFRLHQIESTTISLSIKQGNPLLRVAVMEETVSQTLKADNWLQGSKKNRFGLIELVLTTKALTVSACKNCVVWINIEQEEMTKLFGILEVTFKATQIEPNIPKSGMITKGNLKHFTFTLANSSTLLFALLTQSSGESGFYLATSDTATASNAIATSIGNRIKTQLKAGLYYIIIEGTMDMVFHFAYTKQGRKALVLQESTDLPLSLNKGEVAYFWVHKNKGSKMYAMLTFGQVIIYANRTEISQPAQIETKSTLYQDFRFRGDQNNAFDMSKVNCKKCFVLLAVKALKQSLGIVSIATPHTVLSLQSGQAYFRNLSQKGQKLKFAYRETVRSLLILTIFQGTVLFQSKVGDVSHSMQVTQQQQQVSVELEVFNGATLQQNQFVPGNIILFEAQSDEVLFEFQVQHLTDSEKGPLLAAGHSNMRVLSPTQSCFRGVQRDTNETLNIYLKNEAYTLNNIDFKATIGRRLLPIVSIAHMGNALSIVLSINQGSQLGSSFEVCATVPQSLNLSIFQQDQQNIIFPREKLLLKGATQFRIPSNKPYLLEVGTCSGGLQLRLAKEPKELLNAVWFAPEVDGRHVSVYEEARVFEINEALAEVRWMPVDKKNQRGVGYETYGVGTLNMTSTFMKVNLHFDSVRLLKQTKCQTSQVRYMLYLSGSKTNLSQAINCGNTAGQPSTVKQFVLFQEGSRISHSSQIFSHQIDKILLFPKIEIIVHRIYACLVAEITTRPPPHGGNATEVETYKLLYPILELPMPLFRPTHMESLSTELFLLLVLSMLGIVIGVVLILICLRFVKRVLQQQQAKQVMNEEKNVDDKTKEKYQAEEETDQTDRGLHETEQGGSDLPKALVVS